MNARILTSAERKDFVARLKDIFGVVNIPSLLLETGKDKIRAFSGDMPREELLELAGITRIEIVGLYIARREFGVRLGFDATQIFSDEIKNAIELDGEDAERWMQGYGLSLEGEPGLYVIKSGDDFLGCGYCDGKNLQNFVPKERRVRKSA